MSKIIPSQIPNKDNRQSRCRFRSTAQQYEGERTLLFNEKYHHNDTPSHSINDLVTRSVPTFSLDNISKLFIRIFCKILHCTLLCPFADLDIRQNYQGSSEQIIFPTYKVKYALLRIAVPYLWIRTWCLSSNPMPEYKQQVFKSKTSLKQRSNFFFS